jgi:hypothetical protein
LRKKINESVSKERRENVGKRKYSSLMLMSQLRILRQPVKRQSKIAMKFEGSMTK